MKIYEKIAAIPLDEKELLRYVKTFELYKNTNDLKELSISEDELPNGAYVEEIDFNQK